jgi:putative multiple sugar transport system permease protein
MFLLNNNNCVGRDTFVLVITTALVVLCAFVTTRPVIGRQIYAIGGNARAAKLSGIRRRGFPFQPS